MIEVKIYDYLITQLTDVTIKAEMPKVMPDSCVVFSVTDRGMENKINMVTVAFYSYAESNLKAAQLDERVRNAMLAMESTKDVFGCVFGGGQSDFDTTQKRYRYRSYINIYY